MIAQAIYLIFYKLLSMNCNLPDALSVMKSNGMVRFKFDGLKTNWMDEDDPFIQRICCDRLNRFYLTQHLTREIEIKNVLDEGFDHLARERYGKAIGCFDEVISYDDNYARALIGKSHALYGQGHFVKALRFYKKSGCLDKDYHRLLLEMSSSERDSFPVIKRNIYAGDEAASKGDFEEALLFYDRALVNPSKFKNKILYKLLNKKAVALFKLERFDEALASFDVSLRVHENDLAYFGRGYCQYRLNLDCHASLKAAKKIGKRYLLIKAEIFDDLGFYEDSLQSVNEFFTNHFALDDDFAHALSIKVNGLENMGLDCRREKEILDKF